MTIARLTTNGRARTRVLLFLEERSTPREIFGVSAYAEYGLRNTTTAHWLVSLVILRPVGTQRLVVVLGPTTTLPVGGYPRTLLRSPVQLPRDSGWLAVQATPMGQPEDLDNLHVLLEVRDVRAPRQER